MPVRITLKCGRELFFPNESYADLVAKSVMGTIRLMDGEGDTGFLTKSEIAYAKQIDPAKYGAQVEALERAGRDAEARRKSDAAALLESKTLRGRLRRLFGVRSK